jgi:hypothetical protein
MRVLGRRGWIVAITAVAVGVAGCKGKGRTDYSESPDSGAVAPAMKQDTSLSRTYPDSTTGGPDRTGKRGVAGDTLSTRGQPAGTGMRRGDTANKARPNPKP